MADAVLDHTNLGNGRLDPPVETDVERRVRAATAAAMLRAADGLIKDAARVVRNPGPMTRSAFDLWDVTTNMAVHRALSVLRDAAAEVEERGAWEIEHTGCLVVPDRCDAMCRHMGSPNYVHRDLDGDGICSTCGEPLFSTEGGENDG